MKWHFSLRKEQPETYLKYKRGDIIEEKKTERKELHSDESFVQSKGNKEVTDQNMVGSMKQDHYVTEEEYTERKIEENLFFSHSNFYRGVFLVLCFILFVISVYFIGAYSIDLLSNENPNSQDQTTQEQDEKSKYQVFHLDEIWNSFLGLFAGYEIEELQGNLDNDTEQVALRYTKKEEEQMNLTKEIHESIIEGYVALSHDVNRYSERKINLISLSSNVSRQKLRTDINHQQLEVQLGSSHPLYSLLRMRLDILQELINELPNTKRSKVIELTNESILKENENSIRFVNEWMSLLDQYRVEYTEENGIVEFH